MLWISRLSVGKRGSHTWLFYYYARDLLGYANWCACIPCVCVCVCVYIYIFLHFQSDIVHIAKFNSLIIIHTTCSLFCLTILLTHFVTAAPLPVVALSSPQPGFRLEQPPMQAELLLSLRLSLSRLACPPRPPFFHPF